MHSDFRKWFQTVEIFQVYLSSQEEKVKIIFRILVKSVVLK